MKRILIVTSSYTGAGHKSIADALTEQFSKMPDVEIKVIEAFDLMGWPGIALAHTYGIVTRNIPWFYNFSWNETMKHKPRFRVSELLSLRRFKDCIRSFHPDLIITVHSLFNSILTNLLKMLHLDIPVVVLQADLVNIHSTWCNPDARMTICPTQYAYDSSVRQGLSPEKLQVFGFPARERFFNAAQENHREAYDNSRKLRCLLMSGGEGSGNIAEYARVILEDTDADLTVVCGRNELLKKQLEETLKAQYGDRITVLGFVSDVERVMGQSDLLITRSSPNILTEAVVMNLPLIMIRSPLEQEKDTPFFMEKNGLGVLCESPKEVPEIIQRLLANNGARLNEIQTAQKACGKYNAAEKIAEYVADLTEPLEDVL